MEPEQQWGLTLRLWGLEFEAKALKLAKEWPQGWAFPSHASLQGPCSLLICEIHPRCRSRKSLIVRRGSSPGMLWTVGLLKRAWE